MVILLQILLAAVVVGVVLWATARLGRSRLGLALGAGVLAVFFYPWVRDADWAVVGRVAVIAVLAGAVVGLYAFGLAKLRAAARRRDDP
jgi:hypothetical protein